MNNIQKVKNYYYNRTLERTIFHLTKCRSAYRKILSSVHKSIGADVRGLSLFSNTHFSIFGVKFDHNRYKSIKTPKFPKNNNIK
ncbi:MAG: hypothetical protein ACM3VV_06760 [Deltaproteobacteria bacterium]